MADDNRYGFDDSMSSDADLFKEEFKLYKRKQPAPDFSSVIDFTDSDNIKQVHSIPVSTNLSHLPGLLSTSEWKAFAHHDLPGLVVISNPFLAWCQRYLIRRCVRDYPSAENVTNLDAHRTGSPLQSVWEQALDERESTNDLFNKTVLHKLRWTTLGYHHNWDSKVYSEHSVSKFPWDLAILSKYIAAAVGFHQFEPEAAIVNYYHLDSSLGGHVDSSELDLSLPLVSVSLGAACIFLIGGPTKSTRPVAMFLRSGDILVMSGASRLAYHAVPRILSYSDFAISNTTKVSQCISRNKAVSMQNDEAQGCTRVTNPWDIMKTDKQDHYCVCCWKLKYMVDNSNIDAEHSSSNPVGDHYNSSSHIHAQVNSASNNKHDYTSDDIKCNKNADNIGKHSKSMVCDCPNILNSGVWEPFESYLKNSRININVRQVLASGQEWPS